MARKIYGKITVTGDKPPGTQLRVVAWDADRDEDERMGIVPVAEDGSYEIEYSGKDWDWSPLHVVGAWRPDIYIVVEWLDPVIFAWRCVGRSKVYSDQDVRVDREIDLAVTLPFTNFCTVYGLVKNRLGKPLGGYTVTAWDEAPPATRTAGRTGGEGPTPAASGMQEAMRFLGSAVTDGKGEYRIQYSGNPWDTPTRANVFEGGVWWYPDIFIRVHRKTGSGVNYRSPTHQNVLPLLGVRIDALIEE